MKSFLSIVVFIMGISFQQVPAKAQGTLARPNIVWLVGENLKLDLGCYGAQDVETPYLDSLAKEGMRYTKVFATSHW
jgi:arylsulfatase A-like enzyme